MKTVLYFALGVAVGSAATFYITKKLLEKKYEEEAEQRIQDEVKSVKETFMKRAAAKEKADKNTEAKKKMAGTIHIKESDDIHDDPSELSPDPDDPEEKILIKEIGDVRKRYNRNIFEEPYTKDEIFGTESDDEDDDDIPRGPSEGMREDPYPITADEFANENRYFDKVTIFLYEDGVATDEQEQYIDDLDQLIGVDNLRNIDGLVNEDGSVLIRNELRSTDYEILIRNETYIPDGQPVVD